VSGNKVGTLVVVTDAGGIEHHAIAASSIEGKAMGHSFPVIWVSFEAGGQCIPWPAESVLAARAGGGE
jgi:hypothetical protein